MYGSCCFLFCLIQLFKVQSLQLSFMLSLSLFSLACSFLSFICICIERLQQFSTSMSLIQKACCDARTSHNNIPPLDSSYPASAISNINIFRTVSHPVFFSPSMLNNIKPSFEKNFICCTGMIIHFECVYKNICVFMWKY